MQYTGSITEVNKRIEELKGAKQLKVFARECVTAATRCGDLEDRITPPSLLITTTPGCGVSTACELLADVLDGISAVEFTGSRRILEFKLEAPDLPGAAFPAFERLQALLYSKAAYRNRFGGLVSIDLSDWLGMSEDVRFLRFLHFVRDNIANIFFVFLVPDGDGSVSDMLGVMLRFIRVRAIKLPTPETEELLEYFTERLASMGFRLSGDADALMYDTLSALRESESFCGFKTLNALCDEVRYTLMTGESWAIGSTVTAQQLEHFSSDGEWMRLRTGGSAGLMQIGFTGGENDDRA